MRWVATAGALGAVLFGGEPALAWKAWTDAQGPIARRGHTLDMFGSRAVLFGGRGNDRNEFHLPKTFELVSHEGKLEFASYDQESVERESVESFKLVDGDPFVEECLDKIDSDPEAVANRSECRFDGTNKEEIHVRRNYIPVSHLFNDLWWFDMDCELDPECEPTWELLDPGARLGGCLLRDGADICTHPNERYGHGSAVIDGQVLVIYGGYAQFCGDYCDDAWMYVLPQPGEQATTGEPGARWVKLPPVATPGKRWRSARVLLENSRILQFGGHRLWHGFARSNARANLYADKEELPHGGYLDDLWEWDLSRCLLAPGDLETLGLEARKAHYAGCDVAWRQIEPQRNCTLLAQLPNQQLRPGFSWEQRHEERCVVVWPPARAGHGIAQFGRFLYLFGGYRTYFPFPTSQSPGAGPGTSMGQGERFTPYPGAKTFLDDFWMYDMDSGYWHEVDVHGSLRPEPRTDMSFLATRDLLVLFGGYMPNHHLGDFWYFNTTSRRWLRKDKFVHPLYPPSCTDGGQVLAFPTRGTVLDGQHGRLSEELKVNLTRRQAPGWDGCRDREDGREDLPKQLQWLQPSQRAGQAVAYSAAHQALLMFGGMAARRESLPQVSNTEPTVVTGDLWQFTLHACVNDCSGHGSCSYGYCTCADGFYGLDCSNTSCPGDFCYYDEVTREQVCRHCCHAPYVHTDADVYVPDLGKQACSLDRPGRSNGICDGNGQCLCAPPFVGLDCAIKDCPNKCSGNGWCSEEYPVSRCMCDPGYTGHDCSVKECINNCSYPNGECVEGTCQCRMWPNPYNRSRPWRRFEGMDCSFLIPFAGSWRSSAPAVLLAAVALGAAQASY